MIVQNPIIGRARKKLGNIYARTVYGKNVLQSCPPSNKAHETPNQASARSAFGKLSSMSNQVSTSLLNSIYYEAPQGRSRRGQWCKDLSSGMVKEDGAWSFNPEQITQLGTNAIVSNFATHMIPNSISVAFGLSELSIVGNALPNEKPCIILIEPADNICISLVDYTTIENDMIYFNHLSTTIIGKDCWLFPLWMVNVGTQRNPILAYGSFKKDD